MNLKVIMNNYMFSETVFIFRLGTQKKLIKDIKY